MGLTVQALVDVGSTQIPEQVAHALLPSRPYYIGFDTSFVFHLLGPFLRRTLSHLKAPLLVNLPPPSLSC